MTCSNIGTVISTSTGLSAINRPPKSLRTRARLSFELVPTITKSKERLDEWEPHVKHYASSRPEAAGRAKLAKGAAAIWVRSVRR